MDGLTVFLGVPMAWVSTVVNLLNALRLLIGKPTVISSVSYMHNSDEFG